MHCFHGHIVDLNNPKKDIVVGAGMLEIQSLNLLQKWIQLSLPFYIENQIFILGIHDLCADDQVAHQFWQLSHVKKIHHTGTYNHATFENDLAILELKKDFKLNDIIRPICFDKTNQFVAGDLCFVSGWGHDESNIFH